MRPDEYQERFGLPGDPVPAPREVGQTVRKAVTRFTSLDAPQNPTFAEMAADTGASFVPGVGQLLAARDIERARRADDPAGMAMAASNFFPVDRLIGALRYGLGKPPISELDVYHGTPHKYAPTEANPLGEFDASKIGTGEGAQALEAASTETPSSLVMPFTERKTAAGRAALKNLHKEQGVTYKDWSFERGGAHTPAGPDSGSPAFDVTMNGTYPDDFYGINGLRYYGTGYDALDAETYSTLSRLANRPNALVTVYRAVEKDAKGKINPGDWVTTSRAYAKEHGQGALNNNFKIVKSTVKARDIWTAGDSMLEWGYHPQEFLPEIKWRSLPE